MLDVVDRRGHRTLAIRDDSPFHFLGGHTSYCQITLTTGISIFRQDVVDIPKIVTMPSSAIRIAIDDERVAKAERDANQPHHQTTF